MVSISGTKGVRPDVWLLLGPSRYRCGYPDRDVAAFRAAFGSECVVTCDRLVMGVEGGRLVLRDVEGRPLLPPKVVYPRIRADLDGGLALVSHLQAMGSVIFNSVEARLNCVNKFRQLRLLTLAGIPVPDTYGSVHAPFTDILGAGVPDPCVVKAVRGSKGSRVFRATHDMLEDLHGSLRDDVPYIFQRFHAFRAGQDLRVVVVDGRAVAAKVRSSVTGFKSNIALGGTSQPCLGLYPEGERLACRAAEAVGAGLAGVDLLFEPDGTFTVCEVNTSPGTKELPEVTPAIIEACRARIETPADRPTALRIAA
ncbi:ATP-grasp domain-containing protein [Streptomyces sp. IBSNAI002]|uniref:ATP-grasp domain-containing protein n=1 Tax=Streptomyces sp. IBSNAI002 TaxID=3457500 RepID=UPI003FD6338A